MQLDKAILNRQSVRKFRSEKPPIKYVIECIGAARFAPMAGNNYSVKFILVEDKEKIHKIAEAAQQPFIMKAPLIVVVCTNPSRTVNAYGERGEKYCKQQAGAAIQNFLLKIEDRGLASCWVGSFLDYLIKDVLDIPEEIEIEAIFPVGYELKKTTKRRKVELNDILYFEKYNKKKK